MEEVLTGETQEAEAALTERAVELIRALGQSPVADPATGLSAEELAGCVVRTLALPDIAALRPDLLAEFPVYARACGRRRGNRNGRDRRCPDR